MSVMNTTLSELRASVAYSSDGCPIAYWEGGNRQGYPVVLLHGFLLDHCVWLSVCEQAGFLEQCYVVIPDLRGHGLSGHPDSVVGYLDGQIWADDLDGVIRSSGLERPAIVAWSYSGRMLWDYIRYYGTQSLRCLNLISAASLVDPTVLGPDHRVLADLCSMQKDVENTAKARFLQEALRILPQDERYNLFWKVMQMTLPEQRHWLRSRPLDYDQVVAGVECPVLITHGAQDSIVLPTHADNLKGAIPNAVVSLYEGAGHAPFLEAPDRFIRELMAFLA